MLGWVGPDPAVAAAGSGAAIDLPPATGRRDGSGTPTLQPIAAVSTRTLGLRVSADAAAEQADERQDELAESASSGDAHDQDGQDTLI